MAILIDPYQCPSQTPQLSVGARLLYTTRARSASRGLPLCRNDAALVALRRCHVGRRAFLLGNGPSLNQCDLTKLKDEITFGVNSIFLNRDRMGFDPTYYVVEDVFVAEDRAKEISEYRGPQAKFFGNYLRYCLGGTPDATWMNVRFRYDDYEGFPFFSKNAARLIWVGGTVSYVCMQLAYYMGIEKLYLLGFDHQYKVPVSAVVEGTLITSTGDDPNHFHPDYFGKGYRWHDPKVDRMERAYRRAREVFEADGRGIWNATVGGALEVLPRCNYGELFGPGGIGSTRERRGE